MDGKKWWRLALRRNLLACFTTCMILGSSGLFFTFPCAFLAVNVSLLLPIITGILFLSCFTSFIITSFMDPGILQQGSDISRHQNLDPQVVKVNGKVFYLKWCQVCQFYQPPRCSHCRLCNVCIEDFDHHCKWVNNCVGRRNYRFFFFFVFFLAIYMLTILGSCLMYLIINYNEPIMVEKSATYAVLVPITFFLFPVLFLFGAHTEFIALGVTMFEKSNDIPLSDSTIKRKIEQTPSLVVGRETSSLSFVVVLRQGTLDHSRSWKQKERQGREIHNKLAWKLKNSRHPRRQRKRKLSQR
ncbi:palmitoyltransferase ZDHHC19-like isoform X2 [Narcine bancroftii]|uniref:palmitoyltransferase ZDHHC19-like isoform X2 n=1 Tax=Narcine bancroftii TaxID=1343680 RepID=UPI00383101E8